MDCFYVPRLLQRFFCDDNVFTPQTELCAAQVVQTRKITHKSGQQCFFDAPKSSSVVSDNIYCQQTFLAFFAKVAREWKCQCQVGTIKICKDWIFVSLLCICKTTDHGNYIAVVIVHSYHQFGGEFHVFLLQNLEYQSRQGSFKVERTSIFRYCNFSQPKLQPVSNFIFHSSTNDFKGFLHESFLQFPLFSLQNEGVSSLRIYSWHSGSHTSPIFDKWQT